MSSNFRASLFGFLHVFHENLTIPEYSGRQIVGWAGVGMLILSLTGIWLWWPRGGDFLRGLRWRRSSLFTFNLHHLLGFWISLAARRGVGNRNLPVISTDGARSDVVDRAR